MEQNNIHLHSYLKIIEMCFFIIYTEWNYLIISNILGFWEDAYYGSIQMLINIVEFINKQQMILSKNIIRFISWWNVYKCILIWHLICWRIKQFQE